MTMGQARLEPSSEPRTKAKIRLKFVKLRAPKSAIGLYFSLYVEGELGTTA